MVKGTRVRRVCARVRRPIRGAGPGPTGRPLREPGSAGRPSRPTPSSSSRCARGRRRSTCARGRRRRAQGWPWGGERGTLSLRTAWRTTTTAPSPLRLADEGPVALNRL